MIIVLCRDVILGVKTMCNTQNGSSCHLGRISDGMMSMYKIYCTISPFIPIAWSVIAIVCGIIGVSRLLKNDFIPFCWMMGIALTCEGISLLRRYLDNKMLLEFLWYCERMGSEVDRK